MHLSFSTAALFPRNTKEALEMIEKAGFSSAELMPQCKNESISDFALYIKEHFEVQISSVHFPVMYHNLLYRAYDCLSEEMRVFSKDLVKMAAVFGSDIIVIHPPYFHRKSVAAISEKSAIENIRYLCEIAADNGIKVALENFPRGSANPEEIKGLISKVGSKNLYPMIDLSHAKQSKMDPVKMIKALRPVHIHASDFKSSEFNMIPGQGSFDWGSFREALHEIDYNGLIVIEPDFKYLLEDPVYKLQTVYEFMNTLFQGDVK